MKLGFQNRKSVGRYSRETGAPGENVSDMLIGTIKDDLTGRSLMRETWRGVAECDLIPVVACEVD